MHEPEKPTNFLGKDGDEQHGLLRIWTNSILIPAIFCHIPATSHQHFPFSWEHARFKAQGKGPAIFWEKDWVSMDSEKYESIILKNIEGLYVEMATMVLARHN